MFEFKTFLQRLNEVDIRKQDISFLIDKTKNELLEFINKQNYSLNEMKELIEELQDHATLFEIREARKIIEHWNILNNFLEKNPDYKEQWDALCIAMRLKE